MKIFFLFLLCLSALRAGADWHAGEAYTRITNSVAKWNPGTPLKAFRVVHSDGRLGPRLTNRVEVLPLLYPGDALCIRAVDASSGHKGPLNPYLQQCHPTGTVTR